MEIDYILRLIDDSLHMIISMVGRKDMVHCGALLRRRRQTWISFFTLIFDENRFNEEKNNKTFIIHVVNFLKSHLKLLLTYIII